MLATTAALLGLLSPPASDWSRWQGPARDGVSLETEWVSTPAAAPLWRREVGLGYSAVSIAAGRLVTSGHDPEAKRDGIVCLDAHSGELRWRHELPAETHDLFHGGGTLTTPVFEGERVFVSHREGRVLVLEARDGALVWERDLAAELALAPTTYGYSASPLLTGGRLIVAQGGVLLALEPRSGALLWRSQDYGDGAYANPLPFEYHGRAALVAFAGPGVVVLDAADGRELARAEVKGPGRGSLKASTPLLLGERVLVSGAFDFGCALVDFAGETPRTVWHNRNLRAKVSGVYRWGEALFGFDESMLACIGLDGEERWRVRGLGMGALSIAGGRLLVSSSRGELIVADASPEAYRELSRTSVLEGGVYWTAPVIADGLVYCRSSLGSLVCLDHRPGAASAPAEVASSARAPSAEELLERHRAASACAAGAPRSLRLAGTFESTAQGITAQPMVLEVAGGRWALTVDMGEFGRIRRGCDGRAAWSLDPFYGDELRDGALLAEAQETWPVLDLARFRDVVADGRSRFAGREVWSARATGPSGRVWRLHFDPETGLLCGTEGEGASMVRLEDWRELGGVAVPTRVSLLEPETGIEDRLLVASLERDVVEPAAFERPAEVVRMLRTPEEIAASDTAARERHAGLLGTYVARFEPFVGADAVIDVAEGDLRFTLAGRPPSSLDGPDVEGRFAFRGRPDLSLRFERGPDGRATAILLVRPESGTEDRLERKE